MIITLHTCLCSAATVVVNDDHLAHLFVLCCYCCCRRVACKASCATRTAVVAQAAAGKYDYDLVIVGCGVGGHGAALHAVEQVGSCNIGPQALTAAGLQAGN